MEPIKAAWVMNNSTEKMSEYIGWMRRCGFNTACVVSGYHETRGFRDRIGEWINRCKDEGLRTFALFNWQPPPSLYYRPVKYPDGTEGLAPCPVDERRWNRVTLNMINTVRSFQPDGVLLDTEPAYRLTESGPHYYDGPCHCPYCQGRTLSGEARTLAAVLNSTVRRHKKDLLFGVYPSPDPSNWFLISLMQAWGETGVISFATHTYGYSPAADGNKAPADIDAYFTGLGVKNGTYCGGRLIRKYTPEQLAQAIKATPNYWVFPCCRDGMADGLYADALIAVGK